MLQTILQTLRHWLPIFGWPLLSIVLNRMLAHKAQIEKLITTGNPRMAGLLTLMRGSGIDPWFIWDGLQLIARGHIPPGPGSSSADRPTPPDVTVVSFPRQPIPPLKFQTLSGWVLCVAALMLGAVSCTSTPSSSSPGAAPCGRQLARDIRQEVEAALRGESYKTALKDLESEIGRDGPAAVACEVKKLRSEWASKPAAAPATAAARADDYLHSSGSAEP